MDWAVRNWTHSSVNELQLKSNNDLAVKLE